MQRPLQPRSLIFIICNGFDVMDGGDVMGDSRGGRKSKGAPFYAVVYFPVDKDLRLLPTHKARSRRPLFFVWNADAGRVAELERSGQMNMDRVACGHVEKEGNYIQKGAERESLQALRVVDLAAEPWVGTPTLLVHYPNDSNPDMLTKGYLLDFGKE